MEGHTHFYLLIVCCCILSATPASVKRSSTGHTREQLNGRGQDVGVSSNFCQLSNSRLYCDFKWNLETVFLRNPPNSEGKYDVVFIQRAHELILDSSICLDITLRHISKVQVVVQPSVDCPRRSMSLQNVTLDVVGNDMTSVYADESYIKELSLNTHGGQLTVIGSKVDVLSIPEVTGDEASLKIHSSSIKAFKQLRILGKGRFHLQDSSVENFPSGSLVLEGSQRNIISGVQFNSFDEDSPASIVLSNGADITMEDIKGGVKISSPTCSSDVSSSSTEVAVNILHPTTSAKENKDESEEERLFSLGWSRNYYLTVAITASILVNVMFILTTCCLCLILLRDKQKTQKITMETVRKMMETMNHMQSQKQNNMIEKCSMSYEPLLSKRIYPLGECDIPRGLENNRMVHEICKYQKTSRKRTTSLIDI